MSYPPPPGFNPSSTSNGSTSHPSLPARPPPSNIPPAAFKPAFSSVNSFQPAASRGSSYPSPAFQGFQPRQLNTNHASARPAGTSNYQQQPQYSQQSYHEGLQDQNYGGPQIRNPFPLPGQEGAGQNQYGGMMDPDMEAQIAQWNSAYTSKDAGEQSRLSSRPRFNNPEGSSSATSSNAAPLGRADVSSHIVSSAVNPDTGVATVVSGADGKQATVVRSGGGTQWTDSSLLEWDPAHFRIFVGNLAGEVTDDSLLKAFSKWPSVQKARVVRDKRTTKSKGFGFVSFSDGDDFFQAAREMQGKYIGSHPVLIKRSTTEIKAVVPKDNKKGRAKSKNGKNSGGGGGGGANTGAGVQKPGSKTKGGLRVLG